MWSLKPYEYLALRLLARGLCQLSEPPPPFSSPGAGAPGEAGDEHLEKMKFHSSARPDLRITPAWRLRPRPALPGQPLAIVAEKTPTKKSRWPAIGAS
jgi:hypothetical protein